jgi:AraC family transcriptional regulator, transcriptional activator of pobA
MDFSTVGVAMASETVSRDLAVDRLPDPGAPIEVVMLADATFGEDGRGAREPHRHDYHELFWTREGEGEHLIDGRAAAVRPRTVTLVGRGQVHVLRRARGLTGAVVRFGGEIIHEGPAARAGPAWLLGGRGQRTVDVPASEVERVEATIATLAAETRRPPDACSIDVQRHFLAGLLLWVERWYDAARTQQRDADDAEVQLHRRFAALLERDFARHHETTHYADALAVPPAALSRALSRVTGRTTKEHVTDRVMLEAARLLRFTDLTVGEVAFRAGFGDQLYFSRAFKRHYGEPPVRYRARLRGRAGAA